MKGHYIVIAESIIGSHRMDGSTSTDLTMYALTYLSRIEKINNEYLVRAELNDNKTFRAIIDEYVAYRQGGADVSVLVSFDLDENGEIMAEAMKDALIDAGVDPFDIFRVPLTESGYVAIKEFADTSKFKVYLWHQQRVMERLVSKGLPKMGLMKMSALLSLVKYRGRPFDIGGRPDVINPDGTSTATFIHNYLNTNDSEASKLDQHRFA
ncbi:MAG: hypothetical protein PHT07_10630 [Paludibacter sp.]|nr:hypothetical protein [Paludibacter sp.]